jgi:putative two-component system response regulator
MSMDQFEPELKLYKSLFTIARLIDSESICRVERERDAALPGDDPCPMKNERWKQHPCENCAVCEAYDCRGKKTKLEFADKSVYQVTAKYLEIDGKGYVLELVQKLDGEVPNEPYNDSCTRDKLSPYRDRLYIDPVAHPAYNRRYYEDMLKNSVMDAGVAVVDLDDFKLYNDVFGHHAGDLALEMFAKVAQQNIRKSDTLVRYGGDEFLIVMPNIPERVLQRKLQLICSQIHDSLIPDYPNMQVSVSIGATIAHDEPISSALERADRLMYRAKTRKNAVVMEHENEQAEEEVPKQKVLIVDDAEMNRAILTEILGNEYEILEAENGRECMQLLQKYRTGISVILLDIVMPVMNGFAVLGEMARQGLIDDIPIIMISSADSDDVIRQAYELGVTDYISRPFDAKIVYRRVVNAIKLYAKQRRLVSMVTKQIVEKEKNDNMLIDILSHIVEFRNTESGLHVLHMKQLTELFLSELLQKTDMYHLDAAKRDLIVTASALHDIGKIAIPEEILNKPGRLTKEEFEIMKTHTTIGSEMLDKIEGYGDEPLVRTAYAICRWHHERYDGHGYPDGLVGEQIPISAQIVALADVYDALVSERSYKKAFSHETAVQMILNGECGTFNPLILDCLSSAADKIPQIRYDADMDLHRRKKKDAAADESDSAANTTKA